MWTIGFLELMMSKNLTSKTKLDVSVDLADTSVCCCWSYPYESHQDLDATSSDTGSCLFEDHAKDDY